MTPKEKLARAVGEPKGAPKELTESMVATVRAIEKGREAEKGLKALGNSAPSDNIRDLAAVAAVGRLAQNNRLPAGADVEKLAAEMKDLPAFDELASRSPVEVQHDLENGKFTDDLTRAAQTAVEGMTLNTQPALNKPEPDEPELDAPEKQAPLM